MEATVLCDLLLGPTELDRLLKNLIYETFTDVGRCWLGPILIHNKTNSFKATNG